MRAGMRFLLLMAVVGISACSDQSATQEADEIGAESEMKEQVSETGGAAAEAAAEVQAAADALKAELARKAAQASQVAEAGRAYLHINAQKPGVKVMESGLQFEILEQGDGRSPGPTSKVVTHYHGTFTNGDVFDSSVERGEPAEFPVNRVITGWTEALQMMKEGDLWRLVIPANLAYGERGAGGRIPPNSVLIFEVELIEVKD